MKKTASILLVLVIILSSFTVFADGISVYVNNVKLDFDVQPQMINDRTMVPMRKIFESLGAVVTWDDPSQTATGKRGDVIINVSIDSKTLFKNGVPKTLDVAPALIDGRTLVPVRAIAESFDCKVDWIDETQTVKITTNENYSKTTLTASEISEKVSPSVFYIEVYDKSSTPLGSGSGFFISSDGVAVTNYHVIEGTSGAQITTTNGEKFYVSNIIAFDEELDVAIIRVNKKSSTGKVVDGFPSATMADSDQIRTGQTIYALGSPVGLQNTISSGIISNAKQILGNEVLIQITAPISHGSSGGALVNEYGEILGITSSGIDEAQNIGFAIPINVIKLFDLTTDGIAYSEFAKNSSVFTLELYQDTVELSVGESKEVYVYADGKTDDWSIYWDTNYDNLIDCEWGDWLTENDSVCPLKITGLREGVATVTVYSDVDFKGKTITVYVRKPTVVTYPGSCVPTYTSITGFGLIDQNHYDNSTVYTYKYYNINAPQNYVDYLLSHGFRYYDEDEKTDSRAYYYLTPDNELMSIVLAYKWNEVWIYVPR